MFPNYETNILARKIKIGVAVLTQIELPNLILMFVILNQFLERSVAVFEAEVSHLSSAIADLEEQVQWRFSAQIKSKV